MSTLVMVERNGVACMGADTLTSGGSRKQLSSYVEKPEKILCCGDSFVGLVGWCASQSVLQHVFDSDLPLPEVSTERELFEYARQLHTKLKDDYFLNPKDDDGDPFESSHLRMFVLNRYGMFSLDSMRHVSRVERFWATGSGSDYALGAMHAAYELGAEAEEIARLGVAAAADFDLYSGAPITLKRVKLA